MLRTTRWGSWRHGEFWSDNLKRQAGLADHLITVSPQNRETVLETLGGDPDRVTAIPNGVDIERFRPRRHTAESRRATFRQCPGGRTLRAGRRRAYPERSPTPRPTSIACSAPMATPPCWSSSGRFLALQAGAGAGPGVRRGP